MTHVTYRGVKIGTMGRAPSTPDSRSGAAPDAAGTLRAYGGEGGDTRVARRRSALIDAGLDLLGADDVGAVTVRGVCRQAGLTARYFYESFESVDQPSSTQGWICSAPMTWAR